MVQQWQAENERLRKYYLFAQESEHVLFKLANICTTMMRDTEESWETSHEPARGSLVAPSVDPTLTQRNVGDLKGFGAVGER